MADEQKKTLEALRIAVQMEIDGKEFYIKSSQASSNKLGKNLLQSLAKAEDAHRLRFIQLYEAVRDKNAWPKAITKPKAAKDLKTVFSAATEKMAARTEPLASELEAVQTAMKMESKTFDFYSARAAKTGSDTEKGFYKAIAAEERQHHLALADYQEFLKNPAGWFVKHEHPSIDGG